MGTLTGAGKCPAQPLPSHTRRLLVFVQIAFQGECLAAAPADVRFVGGMGLDVGTEVGLVGEGLAALLTVKGLFSRVRSDVTLEQPRTTESLPTVWTFTTLVVRAHVHAVCRHGYVHFFTMRALAGLLVVDAPVRLSMTCQVAGCAVSLSTLRAHVRLMYIEFSPRLFNQ